MQIKTNDLGFTLIELMIVLVIATIIMFVAVPSFSTLIENNRLITQTNDLVADIHLARSEAVKRSVQVVLCNSANSLAANPDCDGTANTWTNGWLVYSDDDRDGAFDAANDTLIRIGQPAGTNVTVMTNATSSTNLAFNQDGTAAIAVGNPSAIFAICDDRGTANGRQIRVNNMGRPRLISESIDDCSP